MHEEMHETTHQCSSLSTCAWLLCRLPSRGDCASSFLSAPNERGRQGAGSPSGTFRPKDMLQNRVWPFLWLGVVFGMDVCEQPAFRLKARSAKQIKKTCRATKLLKTRWPTQWNFRMDGKSMTFVPTRDPDEVEAQRNLHHLACDQNVLRQRMELMKDLFLNETRTGLRWPEWNTEHEKHGGLDLRCPPEARQQSRRFICFSVVP